MFDRLDFFGKDEDGPAGVVLFLMDETSGKEIGMEMERMEIQISDNRILEFEQFLYERENAKATIQKYKADIQTFYKFLGEEKWISKRRLLEYKEWLLETYKINSVNSMLAALNQFLDFLQHPSLKIKRIRLQKSLFINEEKELTRGEFQKLLQTARKEGKEQLAICMETIASTGIRISELRYFTVERIKQGRITICNKGKYRRIFLPQLIRQKLLMFCRKRRIRSGYIFVTKSGKPKDRSNLWREMKKLKDSAGVNGEKVFPHNLRHYFARLYYGTTKDIAGLADILGHSSLEVTRIYTANTGKIYQKQLDELVRKKGTT